MEDTGETSVEVSPHHSHTLIVVGQINFLEDCNLTSIDFPNADSAIGVNVGMEKLRFESHLGGVEWVVLGEGQRGDEDSVLEICSLGSSDGSFPLEKVVLSDGSSSDT